MAAFENVFAALKPLLAEHANQLQVQSDAANEYTLVTKSPSPFPQHKGKPMYFGSVKMGKAYVSYHLMPLYMCRELTGLIPPELKKHMQGKTCFNFKTDPGPELASQLSALTSAALKQWRDRKWL